MDEEMSQEQEIAESFINGNISWCREQLKGKPALLARVAETISDNDQEMLLHFLGIMGHGEGME